MTNRLDHYYRFYWGTPQCARLELYETHDEAVARAIELTGQGYNEFLVRTPETEEYRYDA